MKSALWKILFIFMMAALFWSFRLLLSDLHDFLVVNRTNEVVNVTRLEVNGRLILKKSVSVEPISGKSRAFATPYASSLFSNGDKAMITFTNKNGDEIYWSCIRNDGNKGKCIFTVSYKGYSEEVKCGCDPLSDFD